MMNYQEKSKEELIEYIKELQQEITSLKSSNDTILFESKQTENTLRTSEENLCITLLSIGDGVIATDNEGIVVNINPVAELLCGWKKADALGKPLTEIFRIINSETKEIVPDPVKKVLESGKIVGLANHTVLISKDKSEYQIADSAAPIKNKEGEITGVVLVFSDVTEKYNSQQQIVENEERYHNLLLNLEAGIVVHAPDTSIVMNNQRASELLGLNDDQMRGKVAIDEAWDFIDEENISLKLDEYPVNRIVTAKKPIKNQILGICHSSKKEIVWVTVNGFPVLTTNGEISEIVISFIDITEQKLAEEVLKQTEQELRRQNELFNSLIENLPMGVFMVEAPSGKPLIANEVALNLLGRGILPEVSKNNLAEVYQAYRNDTDHPYPVEEMPVVKGLNGEFSHVEDMLILKPDGSKTYLEIYGSPVKDDKGAIWASLVSFSDISERKQSESIFKDIIEKNPMSIQILDMEGYVIQTNPALTKLFGVSPPFGYSVFKDEQLLKQGFGDFFNRIKKGEVVYFPDSYFNVHDIDPSYPDSPIWVKAMGFALNDNNGNPERVVLMHENITERKHAEALLNDIIDKNPMSIQIVDKEGYTLHGNPAYLRLFGSLPPSYFSIFDDLKNKSQYLEKLISLAKNGEVVYLPDIYFNAHDEVSEAPDIPLWIKALIFPLKDSKGKPERFVFMHENITERKIAENKLKESELKYRSLIESSSDAIFCVDENGEYMFTNQLFASTFGKTPEYFIGKTFWDIYDKEHADFRFNASKRLFTTGESESIEVEVPLKDKILYFLATTNPIKDEKGKVILNLTHATDITKLKMVEKELQNAKEKAEESESKYFNLYSLMRLMSDTMPDMLWAKDLNNRFIFTNKAVCEKLLIAKDTSEPIGKDDLFFAHRQRNLHPENPEWFTFGELCIDSDTITKKEMKQMQFDEFGNVNGKFLYLDVHKAPLYNDKNEYIGLVGSARDITERKQAETILAESEQLLRESQMVAHLGSFTWDLSTGLWKSSAILDEIFGIDTDFNRTLEGWASIVHPDWQEIMNDYVTTEVLGKLKDFDKEYKIIRINDGKECWLHGKAKLIFDSSNQPIKLIGTIIDISERKQSEKQLNLLKRALDQSPVTVVITNKEGNVEYANPRFIETTGYSISEIMGRNPNVLKSGEQSEEFYENLWNTILSGSNWYGEFHNRKKNGELYWESAVISPIANSNGKIAYFIAIKEDITEKKKMLEDLINAKDRAEESDRLKSAFLANMSHEIRTPMNGILGFAELLKEPELTGEQQQNYIGIIEKSGARMLNIINDIIDISKIEAGLMKVEMQESNVIEQIEYIYTFFKPEVENKGMQLIINNKLSAKEAIVYTDREKLYAILTNLVKNAIKYSNTGYIEIGCEKIKTSQNQENEQEHTLLRFFVKDTGIGIPTDRQQAIFERFIQADIEDEMARQGAGLGLAITKSYLAMMGGEIWVESEVGIGSCFYFTLPCIAKMEEKIHNINARTDIQNYAYNLKILIAEDDETSEMLLSIIAGSYSREIIKVKNGNEAIEACHSNPDIDLILMDIQMPKMGGYEAARQIRKFNKQVVIIAQTAFGLFGDKEKAIQAGCNDYLAKPINKAEFIKLIYKYFDNTCSLNQ